MVGAELIQSLKRTNISVDGEKTKERVARLWKEAPSEIKKHIVEDADVKRVTVYRINNTGIISARLAVALAQRLNIDPYYLTGEKDEAGECCDDVLDRFLREKGYSKQLDVAVAAKRAKRQFRRRETDPDSSVVTASDTAQEAAGNVEPNPPPLTSVSGNTERPLEIEAIAQPNLSDLNVDELTVLLHALYIRARVDEDADKHLGLIRDILIR